ncbi:hypothetical protein A3863_04540 (plasmid) [Priestia endophytica]|uniref:hypothetical protein n=1 Tax=Priestia endophytica TaxID=135735 RepID=UPI000DCA913A|nr:hypothetical protein [Priestia endophytica]RAS91845.1 hypothetical protein A3863_04540 [Priestia endophytica]
MNYFIKLNFSSLLYAVLLFINIELIFNVYRISRIAEITIATTRNYGLFIMILSVIIFTFIYYLLNNKYLKNSKYNYYGVILWIPYFIIMLLLFKHFFPITNHGDKPNPIGVFSVYIGVLIYPIYLAIIIALSRKKAQKSNK